MNPPSLLHGARTLAACFSILFIATQAHAQVIWTVEEQVSGFTMTGSGSFTFANGIEQAAESGFTSSGFIGNSGPIGYDSDYGIWLGSSGEDAGRRVSIVGGKRASEAIINQGSFEAVIPEVLMGSSFAVNILPTPAYYTAPEGEAEAYHTADLYFSEDSVTNRSVIDYEVPLGTYTPRDPYESTYEVTAAETVQVEMVTVSVGSISMAFAESVDEVFGDALDNGPVVLWEDYVSGDTISLSLSPMIPEPSSSALLLLGAFGCLLRRSR